MKRLSLGICLLLLAGATTGCSSFHDDIVSTEVELRNHVLAQKAWNHWSWCYDDLDHPYHFAKGFKAGYRDVLDGGNGCQPTLPPRCYWKPCYQTPDGKCKVHAWFDGFSHGALAAKQDGYGDMSQIPISPTARMNLRMANSTVSSPFSGHAAHAAAVPQPEIEIPPAPMLPAADGDGKSDDPSGQAVPLRPYE